MRFIFLSLILLGELADMPFARKRGDRDQLMRLLAEIDAQEKAAALPDQLGSLMQEQHKWWFASPESPRRRGGHAPCECPDSPGDGYTNACLNRRSGFVNAEFSRIQTPNATTGFSIGSGVSGLRDRYAKLLSNSRERDSDTTELMRNLSDRSVGYAYRADRATQKLLNEESLMVFSSNQAWMSAVNVSESVVQGASRLGAIMDNATNDMISWFNSMQLRQETINYDNLRQTVGLANGALSIYVGDINRAISSLYDALSALDRSVVGSADSSSALADALVNAADSLEGQIQSFNQTLSDLGGPTEDRIQQGLSRLAGDYQTVAQQKISNLQSTAASKISQERNATTLAINMQDTTMQTALQRVRNTSVVNITALRTLQTTFRANLTDTFQSTNDRIDAKRQNNTDTLLSEVANYTGAIAALNASVSSLQNTLTSLSSTERTNNASTKTSVLGYDSAAQHRFSALSVQASGKQIEIKNKAQTIASGSLDAVGSSFQRNMDQMGINTDALISTLSSGASTAAQQSAKTAANLDIVTTQGQQKVDAAGQTVTSGVTSAFGQALDDAGEIPSGLQSSSEIAAMIQRALDAMNVNVSNAASQTRTSASSSIAASAVNLTNVESLLQNWIASMDQDGSAAQSRVGGIAGANNAGNAASNNARSDANGVRNSTSSAFSDSARQISDSEFAAVKTLHASLQSLMANNNGSLDSVSISPALASSLSAAADLLRSSAQTVNNSPSGRSLDDAQDALDTAGQSAADVARTAGSEFEASSESLDQTQQGAMGDLDEFLASASLGAANSVADKLNAVSGMQSLGDVQIGSVSFDQMTRIRAIAASIGSLMQQVNAYLGKNSGPLATDISGLAAVANRLLLQLAALEQEAQFIDSQTPGTGGFAWKDIVSAFSSILLHKNSSVLDQLVEVGSAFNRSAEVVHAEISAQIQSVVSNYSAEAQWLESRLGSSVASVPPLSASGLNSSQSIVGLIQNLTSSVLNASNTSSAVLSAFKTNSTSSNSLPTNMSALYGLVTIGTKAAGVDSQFAASVLDQLAANAEAQVTAVSQFNRTNGTLNPSDVDQQKSIAEMNENIAKAKLQQQQAVLDSLSGLSTDLSGDYRAQVIAASAAASQKANTVFNQVLGGKAEVANMVGQIAAEFAAQQSKMGASASVSSSQQMIDLAMMKRALKGLLYAFDSFTGASNSSFSLGADDINSFGSAVLHSVNSQMSAFDQGLINHESQIDSNITRIQSGFDALNSSAIDGLTEAKGQLLADWVASQGSKIQSMNLSFSRTGPLNESVADSATNATVHSVASAAQSLLSHFNVVSPRIDQIVSLTAR